MKHLLSAYYVSGTVIDAHDIMEIWWDVYLFISQDAKQMHCIWLLFTPWPPWDDPMLHLLCSQIIPLLPLPWLDMKILFYTLFSFIYACWAHKCQKEYFWSLAQWNSADYVVMWRMKEDLEPLALMLLTAWISPEGSEGWVCIAHMYHLITLEADVLSGIAKRVSDR